MGRVIGLPGDTIKTDRSHIWVNGRLLNEGYITAPLNPSAREWKVAPDTYFVLNDNRQVFDDSRTWDTLPRDFIVGKAVLLYWPLGAWHII